MPQQEREIYDMGGKRFWIEWNADGTVGTAHAIEEEPTAQVPQRQPQQIPTEQPYGGGWGGRDTEQYGLAPPVSQGRAMPVQRPQRRQPTSLSSYSQRRTKGQRANAAAIMAAAGEKAQAARYQENMRRWDLQRQDKLRREEQVRSERERAFRINRMQMLEEDTRKAAERNIARHKEWVAENEKRRAKERHTEYQAAIAGIDIGSPEAANQFMEKWGTEDFSPQIVWEGDKYTVYSPRSDLSTQDMVRGEGGKWEVKEGQRKTVLTREQVKTMLEKFQSIESFRESQKRKAVAAKERRAEVKTGIDVGKYKLEVDKFKREGQQGLSDKDRLKMFGYFQRDRAAGMIDPDVTFDDYLSEAGIGIGGGLRGPTTGGFGIPEQQQAGGVRY